jgi:hypothetical protein
MTLHKDELAAWVTKMDGHLTKGLRQRIAHDGEVGTKGQADRRRMTPAGADGLLTMVNRSGVATPHGRRALIDLLRWHYGYASGRAPVIALGDLNEHEIEWIRDRARALVIEYGAHNGLTIVNSRRAG